MPRCLVGVYPLPRGDRQGLFGDEVEGGFGSDRLDLVSRFSEAPDHAGRLVRRDSARDPDEYLLAALHGGKYIPLR